jgi:outer membrane cobalamin receptor
VAGRGFNSTRRQEEEGVFLTARLKHVVTVWWDAQLSYSHVQDDRDFDDKEASSGSRLDAKIDIAELQQKFCIKDIDIVTFGLERREEGADHTAFGAFAPESFDRTRRNLAIYLQNILQPFEGFSLVAGWRFDDDSRFGSDRNYRVSAAYRIKHIGTKLKATVGSGFIAPSLADLFLSIPPLSFPNPNLKPEESESYEVGIEQEFWQQRLRFEVMFFRLRFEI